MAGDERIELPTVVLESFQNHFQPPYIKVKQAISNSYFFVLPSYNLIETVIFGRSSGSLLLVWYAIGQVNCCPTFLNIQPLIK